MTGDHMMKMWFHGGCEEVILFDCWRIDSISGLVLSCLLIFVMGAMYEGVKWFRVYLQMRVEAQKRQRRDNGYPGEQRDAGGVLLPSGGTMSNDVYLSTTEPSFTDRSSNRCWSACWCIAQSCLYVLQLTLAYWLMLIVMTYNSWLTAAVILGAGFGHWIFAAVRLLSPSIDRADAFMSDACH